MNTDEQRAAEELEKLSPAEVSLARAIGGAWGDGFLAGCKNHRERVAPLIDAAEPLAACAAERPDWDDGSGIMVPLGALRALAAAAAKARGE